MYGLIDAKNDKPFVRSAGYKQLKYEDIKRLYEGGEYTETTFRAFLKDLTKLVIYGKRATISKKVVFSRRVPVHRDGAWVDTKPLYL